MSNLAFLAREGERNTSFQGPISLVALTVGGSVEAISRGPELGGCREPEMGCETGVEAGAAR